MYVHICISTHGVCANVGIHMHVYVYVYVHAYIHIVYTCIYRERDLSICVAARLAIVLWLTTIGIRKGTSRTPYHFGAV